LSGSSLPSNASSRAQTRGRRLKPIISRPRPPASRRSSHEKEPQPWRSRKLSRGNQRLRVALDPHSEAGYAWTGDACVVCAA